MGDDDTRTRDSANWLKTFQQLEAQVQFDGAMIFERINYYCNNSVLVSKVLSVISSQAKNPPTMTMAAAQKAADVLKVFLSHSLTSED